MSEPNLRTPPHSDQAEAGLLGSILLDGDRVIDLCMESGISSAECFYNPQNRVLFTAMRKLHEGGSAVDNVTVVDYLTREGELESAGGMVAIEQLLDATPTAAHAEYYIGIVREKYLLRRTLDTVRRIEQDCYESTESAAKVIASSEQAILSIADDKVGSRVAWSDTINDTMHTIDSILSGGVSGVSTGFVNLDDKMRGLRPAEMIVLAARPSMGKTSLAMNICTCLASGCAVNGRPLRGGDPVNGYRVPVGIFSLEMSRESLAMRLLCAKARIASFQLEAGLVNSADATRRFTSAASEVSKYEIYVDDTGGLDVMELRARARRMKKQFNIGLIMIDYLQLLNCRDVAKQGRQLETSAVSAQLKSMAKELNIPVLVLSQLSRKPEDRKGESAAKPRLSDLRDSGAIEQDADVVMLLRRPCRSPEDKSPDHDDPTLAIVDVAKHRNGPVGEVRLNFEDRFTEFSDRAEDIPPPDVGGAGFEGDQDAGM